jgi:hypothetical protein
MRKFEDGLPKQKGSGYEKNCLNLKKIDSNPGKNSWKIKGSKK